jgi:mRNA-degrading endonuclease toxin of MazEF toxin-antitoxin module
MRESSTVINLNSEERMVNGMVNGSALRKGDVYLAEIILPGTTETRRKFVVVAQGGNSFRNSTTVAVFVLTTRNLDKAYPTDVFVSSTECKNHKGAKILANQPTTINRAQLLKFKYSLSSDAVNNLNLAILRCFNIL